MENLEWKDDPSPLKMLEEGESVHVGEWELRVDKMKKFDGLDRVLGNLRAGMTQRERDVLDMRFGLDEDEAERERKRKSKEGQDTHPFCWKVEHPGDGSPEPFSHMGGRAKTKEEAKGLAQRALNFARVAHEALA